MRSEPYEDWISIYNDEIKSIWEEERSELRKMAMIYCAFQIEFNRLKGNLSDKMSEIRLELKNKDRLEKCKNFVGLAQSENFGDIIEMNCKGNTTPDIQPLREFDLNQIKTEDFLIESPNTSSFFKVRSPSPTKFTQNNNATSPILRKNLVSRYKRKSSTSPPDPYPAVTPKIDKVSKRINVRSGSKATKNCNDSNIMESSIIEDTPDLKLSRRKPPQKLQKTNTKLKRSVQDTTLTQMFLEPRKAKKIDSNLPSMTISEMINLINESDSETDAELDQSDPTVDDLEVPQASKTESEDFKSFVENYDKIPENKNDTPKFVYNEVVRGRERKKLKGWACNECRDYYENLNLPPNELEKKKDHCSKHRHKFQPREETFQGFWDLTFKPTPPTQNSEESLIFNYKKS